MYNTTVLSVCIDFQVIHQLVSFPLPPENNREMNKTSGRLNNGIPQVPPKRADSELDAFRHSLPVFDKRDDIVKIIKENRVILIVGETGSGKTTQVWPP